MSGYFCVVRKEELEKGVRKAKIETAKNALALGLSIEQVSKISGLSADEIENIKKLLKI